MKKNKHLLFSAFFILFLFLSAGFACLPVGKVLALEVDLGLGSNPTLPKYVVFLYSWGISIAGGLAAISFVIGAVGLIASGDNSELAGNSKDRMKGAILGLVLIGASFIIMNTINPALIKPTLTPLTPVVIPTPPPQPGVYYYSQSGCAGNGSVANTSSQDNIAAPYNGNIKSVKIIDDATNNLYYGVIFHKSTGLTNGGACSDVITNAGCTPITTTASAADIFTLNNNPITSGNGVTFYSEPHGWDSGQNAGFKPEEAQYIFYPKTTLIPDAIVFEWTNVDRPSKYETIDCPNFQKCPGSIRIDGNYLIAIYSKVSYRYCQTFTENEEGGVPNLKAQPIVAAGGKILEVVYIIPTGGGFGGAGAGGSW